MEGKARGNDKNNGKMEMILALRTNTAKGEEKQDIRS